MKQMLIVVVCFAILMIAASALATNQIVSIPLPDTVTLMEPFLP